MIGSAHCMHTRLLLVCCCSRRQQHCPCTHSTYCRSLHACSPPRIALCLVKFKKSRAHVQQGRGLGSPNTGTGSSPPPTMRAYLWQVCSGHGESFMHSITAGLLQGAGGCIAAACSHNVTQWHPSSAAPSNTSAHTRGCSPRQGSVQEVWARSLNQRGGGGGAHPSGTPPVNGSCSLRRRQRRPPRRTQQRRPPQSACSTA